MSNLITKRFVIRKSLIGKNVIISFTNKKGEEMSYSHDEVYNTHSSQWIASRSINHTQIVTLCHYFVETWTWVSSNEEFLQYTGQCGVVYHNRIVHHSTDLSLDQYNTVTIACYYITIIS
jgi:hypothetical protein